MSYNVAAMARNVLSVAKASISIPPKRCYVTFNTPAWDCGDQLTVHVSRIQLDRIPNAQCAVQLVFPFTVTLLRCVLVADKGMPSSEALGEEAESLYTEGVELTLGLLEAGFNGVLLGTEGEKKCTNVVWRGSQPLGPQGGLAGWAVSFEVN